jgi:murein DD-endopeptidase MepM/ murein hydrolase activator NlpD
MCWLFCLAMLASCRSGRLPAGTVPRGQQGVYHQIQRGQTLWSIASAYGVALQTLARANHLSTTDVIHVGQKLFIPGATQERVVVSRCPCSPVASEPSHSNPPPAQALPPPQTFSPRRETPVAEDLRFTWPLQGVVTRNFDQEGQRRHDGIDIAAPQGTPIQAAADGQVIYSDWGPRGYGRLVILRHGTDLVTIYAHNERNLAHEGQFVRQGQHIATVGNSGRATTYHLHFEIRRKTVPVSPLAWLPHDRQIARLASR